MRGAEPWGSQGWEDTVGLLMGSGQGKHPRRPGFSRRLTLGPCGYGRFPESHRVPDPVGAKEAWGP